jgi:hypothetical protein
MVRERPAFVADILNGPLGFKVPEFDTALLSASELTDVTPTEYRADAVVTLNVGNAAKLAVVVEVQLRRDRRKRRSWPAYVATLHARLGCPVTLLVLCLDQAVAAWCAKPIDIGGPGMVLTPLVLGSPQIPVVMDVGRAQRNPELTVFSALAHRDGEYPVLAIEALLAALTEVDQNVADLYTDLVLGALPLAARVRLEELMTTMPREYKSDFARRYFSQGEAKGEAKGEANSILMVLDARGIEVPADVRATITSCTDLDQLNTWVRRAATVDRIQDLFD